MGLMKAPPEMPFHPTGARPGGKDLLCKNHEAASILWAKRASELRNADCGMGIEKANPKIRNPQFEIRNVKADAFCTKAPCPRATSQAF